MARRCMRENSLRARAYGFADTSGFALTSRQMLPARLRNEFRQIPLRQSFALILLVAAASIHHA